MSRTARYPEYADGVGPLLSVVIAAHSPEPARFLRVLEALAVAVAATEDAQVVVVRNGGSPLPGDALAAGPTLTVIDEERPGIIWARATGIGASVGRYIVFIDDDTMPAEDYLKEAGNFALAHPDTGVFGGRIEGEFVTPPSAAIWPALPFLALRDLGRYEKHVEAKNESNFDVPGAGMVLKREVALAFRDMAESGRLSGIGRTGASLASGDDTVCCRLARRMGFSLAYAPQLRLTHIIPNARLEPSYLRQLARGIGASAARIDALFDGPQGLRVLSQSQFLARVAVHLLRNGIAGGLITSAWHAGYREEALHRLAQTDNRIER